MVQQNMVFSLDTTLKLIYKKPMCNYHFCYWRDQMEVDKERLNEIKSSSDKLQLMLNEKEEALTLLQVLYVQEVVTHFT